jgi:serine/threonine protein kinase/Tfp pilus assembly protein PilF
MHGLVGQTLGRYRIVEEIGGGGMGVVCRAVDEHLSRDVALKLLPPDAFSDAQSRARFRTEALALAKLNHPNIATLFDFDSSASTDFLVLEYIPGETLDAILARGRMDESVVVRLGQQLVAGLVSAHERGVLHRDLKPANLRVNPDGLLKILDYGLAYLIKLPMETSGDTTVSQFMGDSGMTGTLPYMAPEQLQQGILDARTDIYGAGVVLYEMVCGRRAFPQENISLLINAILQSGPTPPRAVAPISSALEKIILKAVAKAPADRYQSARELQYALDALTSGHGRAASSSRRRLKRPLDSLAVLPFKNETHDEDSDYLCEGITEALINTLSTLPWLKKVIARSSVYRYSKSTLSPEEAGRELDVRSVLTGRLVRRGDNLRLSIELIDVTDSRHIWGTQYNRTVHEISGLEQVIANEISAELGINLHPRAKTATDSSRSKAYDIYLRGRYFWNKRPAHGMLQRATELFQQAIEADPKFALAYAGIADAYNTQGAWESGVLAPRVAFPQARLAANHALQLDPQLAEAHAAKAYTALHFDWDLESARLNFEHCLRLNPNYVHGRHWYAHLLIAAGRLEEAHSESMRILELDPLDPVINAHLPWHYWMAHDFPKSADSAERSLNLEPNFHWGYFFAGLAYQEMNEFGRAIDCLSRAVQLSGGTNVMRTAHAYALAQAGDFAAARHIVDELLARSEIQYVSSFEIGLVYLALGESEHGWLLLERACDERSGWMPYAPFEPRLHRFHADSRYQKLLARVTASGSMSATKSV